MKSSKEKANYKNTVNTVFLMVDIVILLASVAGVVMGLGWWPQVFKIFKTKSVSDLSITTYLIFWPALIIWLIYGFYINEFPVIISNLFGVSGCGLILIGYFLYTKK